jgi:multiple sugar transport system permease protein
MRRNRSGSRLLRQEAREGWLSVVPVIVVILAVRGYPIATAVIKSFTNWDGLYRSDFVGLANYANLLRSGDFWRLLRNTLILLTNVPLQVAVGMLVAVLLYERTAGWRAFRSLYYLPQVLSPVIVGYLFRIFFGYYGPLNALLRVIGLDELAVEWLGRGGTAMSVIILCLVWLNVGWQGVLMLGGLSSIDPSILDAARLDGAGYWRRTFGIFLPMIRGVIEYSVILSVTWTFTGLFPIIFSITGGGPGYQTTTIDYMIYVKSFVVGTRLGEASALALILLVVVMVPTVLQRRIARLGGES